MLSYLCNVANEELRGAAVVRYAWKRPRIGFLNQQIHRTKEKQRRNYNRRAYGHVECARIVSVTSLLETRPASRW